MTQLRWDMLQLCLKRRGRLIFVLYFNHSLGYPPLQTAAEVTGKPGLLIKVSASLIRERAGVACHMHCCCFECVESSQSLPVLDVCESWMRHTVLVWEHVSPAVRCAVRCRAPNSLFRLTALQPTVSACI